MCNQLVEFSIVNNQSKLHRCRKPVKPVVLAHSLVPCRPHARMPVLEVNLYKKDFADPEALSRSGSDPYLSS